MRNYDFDPPVGTTSPMDQLRMALVCIAREYELPTGADTDWLLEGNHPCTSSDVKWLLGDRRSAEVDNIDYAVAQVLGRKYKVVVLPQYARTVLAFARWAEAHRPEHTTRGA